MIAKVSPPEASSAVDASRTKLRKAAQEFEAMLLADLLKMADREKQPESGALGGYDDMRIQAVSSGLAADGGIGIARMLVSELDTAHRQQH